VLSRLRRLFFGAAAPARAAAPRSVAPGPAAASPGPAGIGQRLGVPEPEGARDLVLYKFDACPFCAWVQRVVAQLELPVSMRDTRADPAARAELSRRTGGSQVPCLFIDGQPLLESRDIITWLEAYAAA
jgi:glutaredoxin